MKLNSHNQPTMLKLPRSRFVAIVFAIVGLTATTLPNVASAATINPAQSRTMAQALAEPISTASVRTSCAPHSVRSAAWNYNSDAIYGTGDQMCLHYNAGDGTDVVNVVWQSDGNLVAYDYPADGTKSHAVWATNTQNRGAVLALQTDGNVVIYNNNKRALWAIGMAHQAHANFTFEIVQKLDCLLCPVKDQISYHLAAYAYPTGAAHPAHVLEKARWHNLLYYYASTSDGGA